MMLMLFNWFLFSVPLSCLAFIPDNTEKLTSVIGELTERIADLESRLKVQEKKNREHEELINALSARTCTTSKQSAFKRQQDEMLHKKSFDSKSGFDRKNTDSESSVAITSKRSTVSKKGVNEQVIQRRHGIHDANSLIKDVQNIDRGKDKKVTLACKRGEKLKCTVASII